MQHAKRDNLSAGLPDAEQLRRAVERYVRLAWPDGAPETVRPLLPPEDEFDPLTWLNRPAVQVEPDLAGGSVPRSFSLRLGNQHYPHMKLRLIRPPGEEQFLFAVDAHDAALLAHARASDVAAVRELNRRNAELVRQITAAWTEANLPTERTYLRQKIRAGRG